MISVIESESTLRIILQLFFTYFVFKHAELHTCIYMFFLHRRSFTTGVKLCAAHDAQFEEAKQRLGQLKEDPGNQVKLKIYALFKQVCTVSLDHSFKSITPLFTTLYIKGQRSSY